MEALAKSVEDEATNSLSDLLTENRLRRAAIKFNEHALVTYNGEVLRAAIDVSRALAEFCNVLEDAN